MAEITAALDKPAYTPGDVMTLTVRAVPPADSTVVVPVTVAAYDDRHTVDFTVPTWRLTIDDPATDWFAEFVHCAGQVWTAHAATSGVVTARLDWLGGTATAEAPYRVDGGA